ncbi:MAG: CAP domain-containing protein [Desulfobacteraceae bacterium]|nr:MAG: CAP domain-containing protein [Desulfobacteraceae bacterium]
MRRVIARHPTRFPFLLLLFSFIMQGSIACGAANSKREPQKAAASEFSKGVRTIHRLINEHRVSQGLKPLELNEAISRVAAEHSRDMSKGKVDFGHEGFEKRAKTIRQKMKVRSIAENVGANMGQADPEKNAVESWIESPGHLKNIEGDFELTGIGVAENRKGMHYFTQIFVKRLP